MGDNTTNFKVNADGSVTTIASDRKKLDMNEANILDIFRIEQAKGGVFASRRMKRRAMKYAKQANVPEYIVEKLMLDNYPNGLANYRRTTWLITWACAFLLFISSSIFCIYAACADPYVGLLCLSGAIGCIGVAGLCLRQYCKVRKKVIE